MQNQAPLVSVIVAVKDETVLLQRCLDSLLSQTYPNTEIIVIDDGSGVETKQVLKTFANEKIKTINLAISSGQSKARNLGFAAARGAFIAIADADDSYAKNRLETQVNFLLSHPEMDVVGSAFTVDVGLHTWEIYFQPEAIYHQFLLNNPMVHSSVMFRSNSLQNGMVYQPEFDTCEDYEVFARNRNHWQFCNLPQRLVHYHIGNRGKEARENQKSKARRIRSKILEYYLPNVTDELAQTHHFFAELQPGLTLVQIRGHLKLLAKHYRGENPEALHKILYTQFWLYCKKNRLTPSLLSKLFIVKQMRRRWASSALIFCKWLIN